MTSVGSVRYYKWLLPRQPSCRAGLGPRLGSVEARLSEFLHLQDLNPI